jgi:hypothetical protein
MKSFRNLVWIPLLASCAPEVRDLRAKRNSADVNGQFESRVVESEIREDEESYILKVLSPTAVPGKYVIGIVEEPEIGRVSLGKSSTGSIEYRPNQDANGSDRFVVGVVPDDPNESELRIEVKLNILPVEDIPEIKPGKVQVEEDSGGEFKVMMKDGDGDPLTLRLASNPGLGIVEIINAETGELSYAAKPNASGTDTFKVIANDGKADSEPTVITVEIGEINDPPVIRPGLECTKVNNKQPVPLYGEDPIEKSPLTYRIDTNRKPSLMHGEIEFVSNVGVATYDPTKNAGFQGWDLFYAQVSDGSAMSSSEPIYLVMYQDRFTANLGSTLESTLVNFQNVDAQDGPRPAFEFIATASQSGTFEIPDASKPNFRFTPDANLAPNTAVDLFFRIKLGPLEAKQCSIRVTVGSAPMPPPQ